MLFWDDLLESWFWLLHRSLLYKIIGRFKWALSLIWHHLSIFDLIWLLWFETFKSLLLFRTLKNFLFERLKRRRTSRTFWFLYFFTRSYRHFSSRRFATLEIKLLRYFKWFNRRHILLHSLHWQFFEHISFHHRHGAHCLFHLGCHSSIHLHGHLLLLPSWSGRFFYFRRWSFAWAAKEIGEEFSYAKTRRFFFRSNAGLFHLRSGLGHH